LVIRDRAASLKPYVKPTQPAAQPDSLSEIANEFIHDLDPSDFAQVSFAHACTMTIGSRARARKRRRDAEKKSLESMLIHAQQVYDDAAAADAKFPPAPPKPNEIRALMLGAAMDVRFKRDGGNPEDMSIRDLITLLDKAMSFS